MTRRRVRDEHGFVLPTRLMVFSISAVAIAGLAFVATQGDDKPDTAAPAASTHKTQPSAKPTKKATPKSGTTPAPTATTAPAVDRSKVYVVIFNNSNIKGLAGRTSTRAQGAGWNVVGSDNWYGTVDISTVYYGPRLKAAADLLAKDLGITRVKPSIAPMRTDRVTVILTSTYQ